MRGEVLQGGDDAVLVLECGVALEAADGRHAHAGYQEGIFAVGLFDAAPARLAGDIHHRRERLMRAAHAGFLRGHGEKPLNQFGIEGGAEPDGLREAGGVERGMAVEALFVEDDRDAEAGVLDEKLLDGVGQLGGGAGIQTLAGLAGPADLAESAAIFERLFGLRKVERSVGIDQGVGLFAPDAHHLRGLLFQGHSRK